MMNKTLISRLVIGALAAITAGGALAGNIQSSSVSIAREVLSTTDGLWPATAANDTIAVNSPLITYSFQGAVDSSSQIQTFQVQLQLIEPAGATDTPVQLANPVTKWLSKGGAGAVQLRDSTPPAAGGAAAAAPNTTYVQDATSVDISSDGKTLWATFVVPAGNRIVTPVITFAPALQADGMTAAVPAKLTGLATIAGQVAPCDDISKKLAVTVKHFAGVTSPTTQADGANNGTADEHKRNGANNNGTLITFPTNIKISAAASTGNATIDVASQNKKFLFGVADATTLSATLINLGKVAFEGVASGYDVNLKDIYNVTQTAPSTSNGLTGTADDSAADTNGQVEVLSEKIVISAPGGFAAGSKIFLDPVAACTTAPLTVNQATVIDNTTATITVPSGSNLLLNGSAPTTLFVCYDVAGVTGPITPSTFSATATLVKAKGAYREQDNQCYGSLFTLGGGVKVDVRNYATASTNGGWYSVLRIINPSETNSGRIYGQLIHADGTYGNWGELTTAAAPLKPRAAMNLTSDQINALLTSAPATNGAGYVAGVAAPVANANGAGDRLRITADGITSVRVQNYLYNPASQNFIEASGDQGVDFDSILNRSPDVSQTMHQDAQRGLAK